MQTKNKSKNNKLWQNNSQKPLNVEIEEYTVGSDYLLDGILVKYDAISSIAHAEMLYSIGILTLQEKKKLISGLKKIISLADAGDFPIWKSDEDCHTAIENYLTKTCGEAGKKIHTGRSRNDQILVTMRLYMKEKMTEAITEAGLLVYAFRSKVKEYSGIIMPGYTHMQRAMPSSVAMWLGSFADALEDDIKLLKSTLALIDQNPLGSVVAYGEEQLGLNREMTTKLLGFSKVQKNPIYCAMSRGKFEMLVLQALSSVTFVIGKFATDMMLFTTKEFGFCSLPSDFVTGSSAMPQKKNYDVCELMRASCSSFSATILSVGNVIDKLPLGYNRDFQLTKEPFIKGVTQAISTIHIATLTVKNLEMNPEALAAACTPELYATEEAYKLVKEKKMPFRDAYNKVAEKYKK